MKTEFYKVKHGKTYRGSGILKQEVISSYMEWLAVSPDGRRFYVTGREKEEIEKNEKQVA